MDDGAPFLECITLANNHMVLLAHSKERQLVLWLVPEKVAGVFERIGEEVSNLTSMPIGQFVLRSTLTAPNSALSQAISAQGVLWHRRAAIEVDRRIAAFLAEGDRLRGSSPLSSP